MKVTYATDGLQRIYEDVAFTDGFGFEIVRAFRKRMQFIEAATDERDFYAMKSLHFEKLSGKRDHQYSMRLNDQWRLIIEIHEASPKNTIHIVAIEDYH